MFLYICVCDWGGRALVKLRKLLAMYIAPFDAIATLEPPTPIAGMGFGLILYIKTTVWSRVWVTAYADTCVSEADSSCVTAFVPKQQIYAYPVALLWLACYEPAKWLTISTRTTLQLEA